MAFKLVILSKFIKAIGKDSSYVSIASSAILATTLFFFVFTLGSFFKVPIHIIDHRYTDDAFFTDIYVINKNLDHTIILVGTILWLFLTIKGITRFLISVTYAAIILFAVLTGLNTLVEIMVLMTIPIILLFLIYDKMSHKEILNAFPYLSLNYFAIITIAIGVLSIIISSILISSYETITITVRNYAYQMYLLASSFSTIIMFLLVFCFPLKLLIKEFGKILPKSKRYLVATLLINKHLIRTRIKIVYILLFMTLSIALVIIPHQPTINKDNHHVGADTPEYITLLEGLKNSTSTEQFFQRAFGTNIQGDRPLSLIFLYALAKLSPNDLGYTIDYVPLILGPSLVLVIYFLMRELFMNDIVSLFASFITVVSFHTLIGIYAGFYANWFALIVGYLSFTFLFRFLKISGKLNLILYGVLLILLLFTHIYTWSVLTLVIGIFLVIMLKLNDHYSKRRIILLLLVALSSVAVDFARMPTAGSSVSVVADMEVAHNYGVDITQFFARWNNLINSVHIYFGGIFANFLILILGIYWLLRSDLREPPNIFVVVFLSLGIIPVFFGTWTVQTRVFYEIPFQIPSAIALTWIKKQPSGTLIYIPFCIWLIAISVINVANF